MLEPKWPTNQYSELRPRWQAVSVNFFFEKKVHKDNQTHMTAVKSIGTNEIIQKQHKLKPKKKDWIEKR